MPKTLLDSISIPPAEICDCCGEVVADPAGQLAQRIFRAFPPVPAISHEQAQSLFDSAVDIIEQAFGELACLLDEGDSKPHVTVN